MPAQPDSPKYADLLSTAKRLFWKHGIRRVSIEEICREAGVSKMTFYRFFPNKIELAKTMLEGIFDESMREYRALMDENIPFEEKVRRQLLMKFKGTEAISAEFVRDIYSNHEWGLGAYMQQRTEETLQVIMSDYAHAQRMGWIRQELNLNFMLYILHQMPAWISDEQLAASYDDIHDLIMEIANFFFYGVLPHSTESNE
jgi:AcrR family transcriptional regulator